MRRVVKEMNIQSFILGYDVPRLSEGNPKESLRTVISQLLEPDFLRIHVERNTLT